MPENKFIEARVLEGTHVRLEPITEANREEIRDLLQSDPESWTLQTLSAMGEHFDAYWRFMTTLPKRIPFAVRGRKNGRMAGTSSFIDVAPRYRSVEIGFTFFRPEYRGTAVNPETKLLMLSEAFGGGAQRIQFSVSAVNARSRAAVLKLGAKEEALLRKHRITWTGATRDTVLFSITDEEWPDVERKLKARVERA